MVNKDLVINVREKLICATINTEFLVIDMDNEQTMVQYLKFWCMIQTGGFRVKTKCSIFWFIIKNK